VPPAILEDGSPLWPVSILTRRDQRVPPAIPRPLDRVLVFQSSPAAISGCHETIANVLGVTGEFQSSPAAISGCHEIAESTAYSAEGFQSSPAAISGCHAAGRMVDG